MDADEEAEETEDSFVLNILDEQNPFDDLTLSLLKRYIQAFFGVPILVKQTPATYISPPGILALSETTNCPLKQREPRNKGGKEKSTKISHLLECLRTQKVKGNAKLGPFPKCAAVLAVTSGELWEDESGIVEEFSPVFDDARIEKYGIFSAKHKIAIISLAHLMPELNGTHFCNLNRPAISTKRDSDDPPGPAEHQYRCYLRNLLKSVSYFAAKTLGVVGGCFQQRCLCYKGKKFSLSAQPDGEKSGGRRQFLCVDCEIEFDTKMIEDWRKFIRFEPRVLEDPLLTGSKQGSQVGSKEENVDGEDGEDGEGGGGSGKKDDTPTDHNFANDPYEFVETRWRKLSLFLQEANGKVGFLQYKFRKHYEFERELDWLNYALRLIDKYKPERHTFIPKDEFAPPRPPPRVSVGGNLIFHEGPLWKTKKRSLTTLLNTVYREAPHIDVLHRTLEEPFIQIRCLSDMGDQGPLQTPVPSENLGMSEVYWNKKHSTGGTYLELGGSCLRPKGIGNFPAVGINAAVMRSKKPLKEVYD